ncbi:cation diffusion facilitator family transporter [Williamsia sp. 1135]|uniref:cation diffusion facilitator family transporter n=1 Tax=Williamsia sp. 1135 TaxID=1889262 RepID=UPI000A108A1D|nr:cation diffusion facilitator family transporter [Williamsia sp. 1135]ORM35546.1 cation transporter [Williamsia sp. 1135]
MGQGHNHNHAAIPPGQAASASGRHVRRLWMALGLGLITLVTQLIVGFATSSLALLSDSAHVFTDVLGVFLALMAVLVARRGTTRTDQTFGLYRAEVFAALFNAALLFGAAGWILYEASQRLADPPEVPGLPVVLVALVGLAMNIIAFGLLQSGAKESINLRGAYLEVMADMIGSVGVLVSGLVTLLFGWRYADPLIGVGIGLFVLPRAYSLARGALRILFQHAPSGIDVDEVLKDLTRLEGVVQVHDLHVWTLTSGMEVASAHVVAGPGADHGAVMTAAQQMLTDTHHLKHATVQVEPASGSRCHDLSW